MVEYKRKIILDKFSNPLINLQFATDDPQSQLPSGASFPLAATASEAATSKQHRFGTLPNRQRIVALFPAMG